MCWSLFFNKAAGLQEICEILKNSYLEEHLQTAASEIILVKIIICCNKRILQDILPSGEEHTVANTISQQAGNSFLFLKKGKRN